jgi:ABC-2 type transport system permease protein
VSAMGQIVLVARRDFLQRATSKAFLATMLTIVGAVLVGGAVLAELSEPDPRRDVAVTEFAGSSVDELIAATGEAVDLEIGTRAVPDVAAGEDLLTQGEVDAVVVAGDPPEIVWQGDPDSTLEQALVSSLGFWQQQAEAERLGLAAADQQALLAPDQPVSRSLQTNDTEDDVRQGAAFIAMLLLYMSVIIFGQFVMIGVMEEKASRVVEVLLSRVRTHHLLAGKVLGIGTLALLQIVVLSVTLYIAATQFFLDDDVEINLSAIVPMLGWFLVGFTFYAVLYAALGSTVTRQEDAQSVAVLPIVVVIPAYFVGILAVEDPGLPLVTITSIVPPLSPFVMPVRAAAIDVPWWEVALSVALLLAATYGMIRLAGRVYEGAILSIGRKVSLREAWQASRQR